jgi:hypothetical protein
MGARKAEDLGDVILEAIRRHQAASRPEGVAS